MLADSIKLHLQELIALFLVLGAISIIRIHADQTVLRLGVVLSDYAVNTSANQTITFSLTDPIAAGESFSLQYSSLWQIPTGLNERDIDVLVNGVQQPIANQSTLPAPVAIGVDVTLATKTIRFTNMLGSGTPYNSTYTIRIGDNAVSQAVGTNKITNPTTSAGQTIEVVTTAGHGVYTLPIRSASTVSVSKTPNQASALSQVTVSLNVPETLLNFRDIFPPVFGPVVVSGITSRGANIRWTTDESSTTMVDYGTTPSYGDTKSGQGFVTNHSIVLTDLAEGTVCYYRVRSTDAFGNERVGSMATFQTAVSGRSHVVQEEPLITEPETSAVTPTPILMIPTPVSTTPSEAIAPQPMVPVAPSEVEAPLVPAPVPTAPSAGAMVPIESPVETTRSRLHPTQEVLEKNAVRVPVLPTQNLPTEMNRARASYEFPTSAVHPTIVRVEQILQRLQNGWNAVAKLWKVEPALQEVRIRHAESVASVHWSVPEYTIRHIVRLTVAFTRNIMNSIMTFFTTFMSSSSP